MPGCALLAREPNVTVTPLSCAEAGGSNVRGPMVAPRQFCLGHSCLLSDAVLQARPGARPNVTLSATALSLAYKTSYTGQLHEPLCQPACTVRGLTVYFGINMLSPYHFFRDNVKHLLVALHSHGITAVGDTQEWPLRTPAGIAGRQRAPLRLLLSNRNLPPAAIVGYLSAVTMQPIWTMPEAPACVRFEHLLMGVLGANPKWQTRTGETLAGPLTKGLGVRHCPPAPSGLLSSGQAQRPRITLLLRTCASHGVSLGRKVLNPAEVETALGELGSVRRASFESVGLKEQLNTMLQTDVLVGVHGAGLSNAMFLHRCGLMIEMWPLGRQPAGAYSEFHANYVSYHDTFCNASVEVTCDFIRTRNDHHATYRPLLVDTDRLVRLVRSHLSKWRSCAFQRDTSARSVEVLRRSKKKP